MLNLDRHARFGAWLRCGALCAAALAASPPGTAAVYRWVDDQGRTHYADTVPERYRDRATRVDTGSATSPAGGAVPRAPANTPATPGTQPERRPPRAAAAAPPASTPARRPAQGVTASTDCATWWRLYDESEACFGPLRTVGGGLKPEAFDHCTEVPNPAPRCGPRVR